MNYLKLINQFKLLFFKKKDKVLSALTKQERYNIYLEVKEHLVRNYFANYNSGFCQSLNVSLRMNDLISLYKSSTIKYFPELMYHQPLNYFGIGYWFPHSTKEGYEERLKIINKVISDYETIN